MKNKVSRALSTEFRQCNIGDFRRNGYDREVELGISNLLCPDVEWMQWEYKMKNGYSQKRERTAITIEIAMCNQDMVEAGCKNDTEIEQLLKSLVFTSYFVTEGIDFENEKNLGKRPVSIDLRFF